MMKRVNLFVTVLVLPILVLLSMYLLNVGESQTQTLQNPGVTVMTKELQDRMTPEEILQRFEEGNQRFLQGKMLHRDYLKEKDLTAAGQHPYAIVLSCIDSRKPVEIIFDKGIGDIFNARIAGNFVNTDILGSMEYATKVSGAKLILIMGHSNCGAIKSAIDNVQLGNITAMLSNIQPAVKSIADFQDRTSKNKKFVEAVAKQNVVLAQEKVLEGSPIIKELVDTGKVEITGCMYDIESGVVTFYE
jgi:carbonic anhydrase